jgi:hypothetical protein
LTAGDFAYVPKSVKTFIGEAVSTIPDPIVGVQNWEAGDGVIVEASGHEPGTHNIKIEKYVTAAAPAPPPTQS